MKKAIDTIALRIDSGTKKKLQALADADNRSLSDYIKQWFYEIVSNYEFEKVKDEKGDITYTVIKNKK